jgi:hypothetical protein
VTVPYAAGRAFRAPGGFPSGAAGAGAVSSRVPYGRASNSRPFSITRQAAGPP